jgi:hypothetical protein
MKASWAMGHRRSGTGEVCMRLDKASRQYSNLSRKATVEIRVKRRVFSREIRA